MSNARWKYKILQQIGRYDRDYNELDWTERSSLKNRQLHKDELREIFDQIAPPEIEMPGTSPELRDEIRTVLNYRTNKSPTSEFAQSELSSISRALRNAKYLDASEVDIYDQIADWGSRIVVDGETKEVVQKGRGPWPDSAPEDEQTYDEYEVYYFPGKRERLMVLRGLDTSVCKYDKSVVLERAVDYGPYKRWKKDSYVESVRLPDD